MVSAQGTICLSTAFKNQKSRGTCLLFRLQKLSWKIHIWIFWSSVGNFHFLKQKGRSMKERWSPENGLGVLEHRVLIQFVFPPLSHMTWCILWNQTCYLWFDFRMFSTIWKCVRVCLHLCVCLSARTHAPVHDAVWRLIRFLPLHTWPVWHDSQSRCLGSTQGIREINSRIKLNVI